MTSERLEAFIQLFLLDHGHAVEDEVIEELVQLMDPPPERCHRCAGKRIGRETYTLDDLVRGFHIEFDVQSALAYAQKHSVAQEFDDEFMARMLVVNMGSFCAEHVPHTNPDLPGLVATIYPDSHSVSYVLIDGTHRTVRNSQMGRKPKFYVLHPDEANRFVIARST